MSKLGDEFENIFNRIDRGLPAAGRAQLIQREMNALQQRVGQVAGWADGLGGIDVGQGALSGDVAKLEYLPNYAGYIYAVATVPDSTMTTLEVGTFTLNNAGAVVEVAGANSSALVPTPLAAGKVLQIVGVAMAIGTTGANSSLGLRDMHIWYTGSIGTDETPLAFSRAENNSSRFGSAPMNFDAEYSFWFPISNYPGLTEFGFKGWQNSGGNVDMFVEAMVFSVA